VALAVTDGEGVALPGESSRRALRVPVEHLAWQGVWRWSRDRL